jgi:protein-S-isoprenylcysteine O-methyltransferase Ste14
MVICISLFFVNAPYGRHARRGWGHTINPKWGWFIMESPALLLPLLFFLFASRRHDIVAVIFLLMWEIHYIQRTIVFPSVMKKSPSKMPLLVMFLALFFNLGNGYLNGRYLFSLNEPYGTQWLTDPRFIIGTFLFISGYIINIYSDSILRSLRMKGETDYKIPKGGLFRYVSSPNYLGEIVEWMGWAMATWSLPGAAFFLWTIANLAPRAFANHKWYLKKFSDYPSQRKALVPYIL